MNDDDYKIEIFNKKYRRKMKNRKMILECLDRIDQQYKCLRELVENTSDQELEHILDIYFAEFGVNILVNFEYMQMIISRENVYEVPNTEKKSIMSNEELKRYFINNWKFLVFPSLP